MSGCLVVKPLDRIPKYIGLHLAPVSIVSTLHSWQARVVFVHICKFRAFSALVNAMQNLKAITRSDYTKCSKREVFLLMIDLRHRLGVLEHDPPFRMPLLAPLRQMVYYE